MNWLFMPIAYFPLPIYLLVPFFLQSAPTSNKSIGGNEFLCPLFFFFFSFFLSFFFFFFVFLPFLGPLPRHMEVPRLGV